MKYFQLFNNNSSLVLEEYNENPSLYLRYLDIKRENGFSHIILNSSLLLRLALLNLKKEYTVEKIDFEDTEEIDVDEYYFSPFESNDYKKLIINNLRSNLPDHNLKVNYILLTNEKEKTDIKIMSNGIVGFESEDLDFAKESILELLNFSINQNIYV